MESIIKINLTDYLTRVPVVVELGCGPDKQQGRIGIDVVDLPEVDIVANLEEGLPFFPNNSIDTFYANHVLEHLDHFEEVMREVHRTLKPGGKLILRAPHFSNPFFYSDFTHKRFFGLYSFEYLSRTARFKRKVPRHYVDFAFCTEELKLVFYSDRIVEKIFKRLVQVIVNAHRSFQEAYEEMWSSRLPCSEIYAILTPEKEPQS